MSNYVDSAATPRKPDSSALTDPLEQRWHARIPSALICFLLSIFGTLPLVLLTPPFQVPDEPQHFFRAYQISEFHLLGTVQNEKGGGMLPSSLIDLTSSFLHSRELHTRRSIAAQPLHQTLLMLDLPLKAEEREFVDFSAAVFYSPLPYLPQSMAIAFGRAAGAGPLMLFYLARLANALVAIVILAYAIRRMPLGRTPALVLGLVPMALFLYASISPDAVVITTAFLFTAIALRGLIAGAWATRDVVTAALCAAVFCSVKPVYAPLLMIGLPAIFFHQRIKHLLLVHAVLLTVAIGITAFWMHSVSSMITPVRSGTNLLAQASFIVHDPIGYVLAITRSFVRNDFYLKDLIGRLGWLTLELPFVAYILPGIALLLAIGSEAAHAPRLSLYLIGWNSLLFVASCVLVMTALYLYWTPTGNYMVQGVQGRYFLPLMALASAIICSVIRTHDSDLRSTMRRLVVAVVLIEMGIMHWTIIRAYNIFG